MTPPASFKIGDFVRKVGGRYGGPGQIVGETTELDSGGYKLWNVAMRVEGGEGRFVHVFPSNVLMHDPNGAKAAASLRAERDRLQEDNGRLRGKVAALEMRDEKAAAHRICNWLRRQATAEKEPKARAAFIEAHNTALAIKEGRA